MNVTQIALYVTLSAFALFALLVVIVLARQKKNQSNQSVVLQQMMKGSSSKFSMDVFYQRVYWAVTGLPGIKN